MNGTINRKICRLKKFKIDGNIEKNMYRNIERAWFFKIDKKKQRNKIKKEDILSSKGVGSAHNWLFATF